VRPAGVRIPLEEERFHDPTREGSLGWCPNPAGYGQDRPRQRGFNYCQFMLEACPAIESACDGLVSNSPGPGAHHGHGFGISGHSGRSAMG